MERTFIWDATFSVSFLFNLSHIHSLIKNCRQKNVYSGILNSDHFVLSKKSPCRKNKYILSLWKRSLSPAFIFISLVLGRLGLLLSVWMWGSEQHSGQHSESRPLPRWSVTAVYIDILLNSSSPLGCDASCRHLFVLLHTSSQLEDSTVTGSMVAPGQPACYP